MGQPAESDANGLAGSEADAGTVEESSAASDEHVPPDNAVAPDPDAPAAPNHAHPH